MKKNDGEKKKGGKLKWIIIVIVAIAIIGALGSGGDDEGNVQETQDVSAGSENESNSLPEETESVESDNTYSVGETADIDNIQTTLVSATESEGSEYNSPAGGNVFVLLEFEIANNSDSDISVSSMMSFEAYCDDYSITQSLSGLLESDKGQLDGDVAAGKKMNGVIAYEVPADWTEIEVTFTPDFWFGDDIVFTVTK